MIAYEDEFINFTGAFPNTVAINVTAPGAGDGTEFVAAMVNDIWGRAQALMSYAGLTPDGVQEAPGTAQILSAIGKGFGVGPGIGVTYWKNGTPAANGDRVLLLQGQVIAIASYPLLVAACYVGDANNGTAPAFYKTSDAGGTTRSTSGTYFVLPDTQAMTLKGAGTTTLNTRTKTGPAFGVREEDQMQGHGHLIYPFATGSGGTQSFFSGLSSNGSGKAPQPVNQSSAITSAEIVSDNTNGTPRTGATTRDCSLGTNFGITY